MKKKNELSFFVKVYWFRILYLALELYLITIKWISLIFFKLMTMGKTCT